MERGSAMWDVWRESEAGDVHNDDVEDLQFGTLNLLLVEGAGVASEGG